MSDLFENLQMMHENEEQVPEYKDDDILTIKISGLAPMSDFDNEEDAKDWANWIEDDYKLKVLEQGDNNPNDGYAIVKGTYYDIDVALREVFGIPFDCDDITIISK